MSLKWFMFISETRFFFCNLAREEEATYYLLCNNFLFRF